MMKKTFAVILLILLLAGCAVPSFAEDIPEPGLDAALRKAQEFNEWMRQRTDDEIAAEMHISRWDVLSPYGTEAPPDPLIEVSEGDTWDDLLQRLLVKYEADAEGVGIGYYNNRTGEEHYINADRYMVSASMFKVPLNMIYADKVSSGEMTMDSEIFGAPYRWYQYRTIVESDNDRSVDLMNYLGGYRAFKEYQIPYLGNDPVEDLGWNYQIENFYNPRQFIHMLRSLLAEPERFPGILENMLQATPYSYLHQYERRYPIAQKYGFVEQAESNRGYHTYINSCGVVFTETPFCLVIFTDNVLKAYDLMAEYCMVMCDYTNMVSRLADEEDVQRQAEEQQAELLRSESDRAAIAAEAQALAAALRGERTDVVLSPVPLSSEKSTDRPARFSMSVLSSILLLWIFIAMTIGFVVIFRHNVSGKVNAFWAVLAIILTALALVLCITGSNFGTLYAKPGGDPGETVSTFLDAVLAEEYDTAYSCLSNYSSLGLELTPETEESRMLYDALKQSYGFTLRGTAEIDRLTARQTVALMHLNLKAVKNDAAERVEALLQELAEKRPHEQIFDENGKVLPAVSDEVYRTALAQALDTGNRYYTSSDIEIELEYVNGRWLIRAGESLLSALSGGAADA
ncbi:MAG: hypothetical protein IJG40_15945 [Oscillospiraceae bacterium]|nr:hypothetical protein [Oscillospiraceae bacterium]